MFNLFECIKTNIFINYILHIMNNLNLNLNFEKYYRL